MGNLSTEDLDQTSVNAQTTMTESAEPASDHRATATKQHIRGSSLLLAGRMLSLGLNLGVQVLLIRYLAKTDYGAFAYAIALVSMGTSITVLGLDKAFSRFVPMYHEREEFDKVFGAIAMSVGSVLGLGLAVVLVAYGFQSLLVRPLIDDSRAAAILLVLIALVPQQSLEC